MPSFTVGAPDLEGTGPVIEAHVAISQELESVLRGGNEPVPKPVRVRCLVDTGATGSVIRSGIAQELELEPVDLAYIDTAGETGVPCDEYAVRFLLPESIEISATALEAPLQSQTIDCLIGRDVLSHGVLVYIGTFEHFTLSF